MLDRVRYHDDMDRERLVYWNGEYYRMRETYLSGGPYTVPLFHWDPYGPWRMARPVQHPMRYWCDLDYRHQHTVHDALQRISKHTLLPNDISQEIGSLMVAPLGADVTVKYTPVITICFGDNNLNYSVEIDKDEVYRIDYMSDAKLSSIIGKVTSCNINKGYDYRGKQIDYVVITIDCSNDFGSNIRTIDSRDIRYISPLSKLDEAESVTRTWIGKEPPADHGEFGGWFNTITGKFYKNIDHEWIEVELEPENTEDDTKEPTLD